jgi:putative ABC transport system permease protein
MWTEYLRIAWRVLRAHKFRSALTMLSITTGAFSIVLMSSLADSGLATMARGLEELGGARLLLIGPKNPERAEDKRESYSKGLTRADFDLLATAMPHVSARSVYANLWRRNVVGDTGLSSRSDVVGSDGSFIELYKMTLAKGRVFSEEENRAQAKVCVVGHRLAEKLFDGEAVGHLLTAEGVRCRVIGQLANQDRFGVDFDFDWLDLVVLPLECLVSGSPTAAPLRQLVVRTDDARSNEITKRVANALLEERHHGVDDFELFDFSTFLDKFNRMFDIMRALVGFIAGIALLVGGIGVMNMMLVSVSERVREIGIRKAVGATPRDIGAQFLYESALISGLGGLVGVAAGIAAALASAPLIRHFTPSWVGVVSQTAAAIAFSVSVGIGLVFGYFPARRAGRLDAILAMRR